ncbi:MAG: hypothetical protein ABWY71_01970 [Candidatus Saccharimonadales bacterium]
MSELLTVDPQAEAAVLAETQAILESAEVAAAFDGLVTGMEQQVSAEVQIATANTRGDKSSSGGDLGMLP